MKWSIHHVQLHSVNVRETVRFFRDTLGLEGCRSRDESYQGNPTGANTDAHNFFGENGSRLHMGNPDLAFALKHKMPINPTYGGHLAITIADLDDMRRRLDAANLVYADPGDWKAIPGFRQIYVCDPSMNIIEINQKVSD